MLYDSLSKIPRADTRAVVIDCGTRYVSTLAVASVLRHARVPLLVVDCAADDHYEKLAGHLDFDWIRLGMMTHGRMLDRLFRELDAEHLLLVDSDAEILDPWITEFMFRFRGEEGVFGSGFLQGPGPMEKVTGPLEGAQYAERMFMPLCLLQTAPVRAAVEDGQSFEIKQIFNDFPAWPRLSRQIAALSRRSALFKRLCNKALEKFRTLYWGRRSSIVYFDTGAMMYYHLRYRMGLGFASIPARIHAPYFAHERGVTRSLIGQQTAYTKMEDDLKAQAKIRLEATYGILLG